MKTTEQQIRRAYRDGQSHADNDDTYWSYYTGVLQAAYDAGRARLSLSDTISDCQRFGKLPIAGRSHNYADNRSEAGISVISCDNVHNGCAGAMLYMSARTTINFRGIKLLGITGSDGEDLVLAIDYYDFLD